MRHWVRFLSVSNVQEIHDNTLREEGGTSGRRDSNLLESAIAMPKSHYGGEYVHSDLAGMAAAYLYHLCQKHPFVDGNKRTAAFSALLFLRANAIPRERLPSQETLERVTLSVAASKMTKEQLTTWLRSVTGSHPIASDALEN